MKYKLAIFDFDGTLADSFPFFAGTINTLAQQYDFKTVGDEEEQALRRLNAREIIKHVGLPRWKLPLVAASFIARMGERAADIPLFPEVEETLTHLGHAGVVVSIVSSNSRDNVTKILGPRVLSVVSHVDCGMSMFGKSSRINKLLKKTKVPPASAIYIGDQLTDLEAAHRSGVAFGAVSWGFSAVEALRARAPEEEFGSVSEIKRIA
ncbi:MAG TPA: HAD hydrolase-like protein [Polyangia bacterium]|jgi:phosphoglycolate phosphatase